MALLDSLKNWLTGLLGNTAQARDPNSLAHKALDLINDPQHGGLTGLVEQFKEKGLGGVVGSWVGTGKNEPISPDQVTQALGHKKVQEMAEATGETHESIASKLSHLLPGLIDKLTPEGKVPDDSALAKGLSALKNALGGSTPPKQ